MAALARIGGRHLKFVGLINSSASCFFTQRRGVASKLFVGGLSFCTTEQGLSEAFSKCGQVVEVMDRVSDRSKGFGFVTFASVDEAQKALMEFNGQQFNGRVIFVDYAKAKQSFGGGRYPIARGPPDPVEVAATTTETSKND
ncbi:glycine-rich RNA-binding protein 5, mitochondrial isoform X2 [Arabidopsis lyrata subsp. lyrata]|uniref:glycine-rich RNA-binding protein 5, mitochondrial isoform X2 n=1 Tax=Arabidopsis lyrata subsp. lyrata TaxID=81972 RepID=UPI000A29A751|nr:glycine-rich RNA-binding protein 5, mitochondrial isoform X2 [Arabidopsis lyrata subsp. lyrata]|eukprot:XP_020876049.1 glycine-rich RNA-binding protein 5, mitochondrial isoform X2 [Arabidopsis lyrata subsp. lyrata]